MSKATYSEALLLDLCHSGATSLGWATQHRPELLIELFWQLQRNPVTQKSTVRQQEFTHVRMCIYKTRSQIQSLLHIFQIRRYFKSFLCHCHRNFSNNTSKWPSGAAIQQPARSIMKSRSGWWQRGRTRRVTSSQLFPIDLNMNPQLL